MTLAHLMENAEERGRKEGEARVKALIKKLMDENRLKDIEKALKDDEYMNLLLNEQE